MKVVPPSKSNILNAADETLPGDPAGGASAPRLSPEDETHSGKIIGGASIPPRSLEFPRGTNIGRHILLDKIGEGGMGIVYAAYDSDLDRKVAIKFLHPDRARLRKMRLLREAQAMARLDHPNVVTVYEVGTFQRHLFVVMEFVDGVDLNGWLAEKPRTSSEILEVLRAAGHGLAAAHAAGIVHRDFKPGNVLVDQHGRAHVTDFGLARAARGPDDVGDVEEDDGALEGEAGDADGDEFALSLLDASLTRTGEVHGTPPYMSPEQRVDGPTDARSDQFSFCVALYEALYREHPFRGGDAVELVSNLLSGRVNPPPAQSSVPRWCRRIVLRGLHLKPCDRWQSMEALLEALSRSPHGMRRYWPVAGAIAASLAAAAIVWPTISDHEACPPARDRIAAIWNAQTRDNVRIAFQATGAPNAADVFGRVEQILEARLSGWLDAHRDACRATHVRGEQSETLLDLRMQCLDRALRQIATLPEIWRRDVKLNEATRAAQTVGETKLCSDPAALAVHVPPPRDPGVVQRLESLRRMLDRVAALQRAGLFETGLVESRKAVVEARQLGYTPVLAEALQQNGEIDAVYGDQKVGLALLHEAFRAASQAHDDRRAATILRWLLYYSSWSDEGKTYADTDLLWKMAEAAVARVANNDDLLANLLCTQGSVLDTQGKPSEAVMYFRRGIAIKEKLPGSDPNELGKCLYSFAVVLFNLSRWEEARAANERARAIWEHILGPEHDSVAMAFHNLSAFMSKQGDYEGAAHNAERALAIKSKLYPAEHPDLALELWALGSARMTQERYDEAQALFERSARIFEKSLGPEHRYLAFIRMNLAELAVRRGDAKRARQLIDIAFPVVIKTYGEDHRTLGDFLVTLGAFCCSREILPPRGRRMTELWPSGEARRHMPRT